ncbi:MAG: AsmA family protein [Candidatus Krumholzibacteria bacterium]|nr:AsmA family protein [Candidatus Krumholzibacteria bacterium]
MRKLLVIVAAVVVLIAVVAFLLIANIDSLVAKAVERSGSEATGTDVRVSGVKIELRDGRGSVEGLTVANPDGYEAPHAFTLEDIAVDLDLNSLGKDPIVIDEIRVKAPAVHAVFTETGLLNIDELRKRIDAYARESGGGEEQDGPAKRIRVARFVFEQGRIELDASALGLEKRTVALPGFDLGDLGGPRGAAPGEIAGEVLSAIAGRAASEVARSGVERLVEEKIGGTVGDKAKDLLKKITD